MDNVTYYKYAYGGISDIRKGRLTNLQTADSLENLERLILNKPRSKIILPQFISVYQNSELKADKGEEKEYLEYAQMMKQFKEGLAEMSAQMILDDKGKEDKFHPNLIHLAYKPDTYDEKLMREFFVKGMERIRISDYSNIPNFYAKDTLEIRSQMERITNLINSTEEDEERKSLVISSAKESYKIIHAQLKRFGLTRIEYVFLNLLWNIVNPLPEKRKIIIPQNEAPDILGKLFSRE